MLTKIWRLLHQRKRNGRGESRHPCRQPLRKWDTCFAPGDGSTSTSGRFKSNIVLTSDDGSVLDRLTRLSKRDNFWFFTMQGGMSW